MAYKIAFQLKLAKYMMSSQKIKIDEQYEDIS